MARPLARFAVVAVLWPVWTSVGWAESQAIDLLEKHFAPHCLAGSPFGFPMKVRAVSDNPYAFWRGAREVFFDWAAAECHDWMNDKPAWMDCHGDTHLGNIGAYAAAGRLGDLGFGLVDFDDSHRLPFQIELLQGVVTLRLTARQNGVDLSPQRLEALVAELTRHYLAAARSDQPPSKMLADLDPVRDLLDEDGKYEKILDKFCGPDRRFRDLVRSKKGVLRDVLERRPQMADAVAEALAAALRRDPAAGALFRETGRDFFRRRILDVAMRCRLNSSGSQGLAKVLVLVESPLKGAEHDVVLYLKQQIPSPPQRLGLIDDPHPPAQRRQMHQAAMSRPAPYLNAWTTLDGNSYWVTIQDPWSDELSPDRFRTWEDLLVAARIWATATGATHRQGDEADRIARRLIPPLSRQLLDRSDAWLARMDEEVAALSADPRRKKLVAEAEEALRRLDPR